MSYRKIISSLDRQGFVDVMYARGWPLLVSRGAAHDDNTSFGLMFEVNEDLFVSWIEPREQPKLSFVEIDGGDDRTAAHKEIRDAVAAQDDETLLSLPAVSKDETSRALSYLAIGVASPTQ